MPRYQVFKKHRHRDGHITRELYLDRMARGVNEVIRIYSRAGVFTSGDYVIFRVLKDGKISRAGKPFTI
jgi:hypothetical protein